ncbi:MAG: hypothetical protein Q9186_007544 [Xanthomendoza sp. 1 TL-2023]
MTRDPSAPSRARRLEQKQNPISIKPLSSSTPSSNNNKPAGFKKGGFKNAFGGDDGDDDGEGEVGGGMETGVGREKEEEKGMGKEKEQEKGMGKENADGRGEEEEEEESDDGLSVEERYDPRRPTGCWEGCEGWR